MAEEAEVSQTTTEIAEERRDWWTRPWIKDVLRGPIGKAKEHRRVEVAWPWRPRSARLVDGRSVHTSSSDNRYCLCGRICRPPEPPAAGRRSPGPQSGLQAPLFPPLTLWLKYVWLNPLCSLGHLRYLHA